MLLWPPTPCSGQADFLGLIFRRCNDDGPQIPASSVRCPSPGLFPRSQGCQSTTERFLLSYGESYVRIFLEIRLLGEDPRCLHKQRQGSPVPPRQDADASRRTPCR